MNASDSVTLAKIPLIFLTLIFIYNGYYFKSSVTGIVRSKDITIGKTDDFEYIAVETDLTIDNEKYKFHL